MGCAASRPPAPPRRVPLSERQGLQPFKDAPKNNEGRRQEHEERYRELYADNGEEVEVEEDGVEKVEFLGSHIDDVSCGSGRPFTPPAISQGSDKGMLGSSNSPTQSHAARSFSLSGTRQDGSPVPPSGARMKSTTSMESSTSVSISQDNMSGSILLRNRQYSTGSNQADMVSPKSPASPTSCSGSMVRDRHVVFVVSPEHTPALSPVVSEPTSPTSFERSYSPSASFNAPDPTSRHALLDAALESGTVEPPTGAPLTPVAVERKISVEASKDACKDSVLDMPSVLPVALLGPGQLGTENGDTSLMSGNTLPINGSTSTRAPTANNSSTLPGFSINSQTEVPTKRLSHDSVTTSSHPTTQEEQSREDAEDAMEGTPSDNTPIGLPIGTIMNMNSSIGSVASIGSSMSCGSHGSGIKKGRLAEHRPPPLATQSGLNANSGIGKERPQMSCSSISSSRGQPTSVLVPSGGPLTTSFDASMSSSVSHFLHTGAIPLPAEPGEAQHNAQKAQRFQFRSRPAMDQDAVAAKQLKRFGLSGNLDDYSEVDGASMISSRSVDPSVAKSTSAGSAGGLAMASSPRSQ